MDKLLPTPNAALGSGGQTSRSGDRKDEALLGNIVGLTSASSPGSEVSTSQPKLSDTDASDKSSGTPTAPESSSDTGPTFGDGETSPSSPLLPTPDAGAWNDGQTVQSWATRHERERAKGYNGNGGGTPIAALIPLLASSSGDSPASPPAPPAAARARQTTAGYGPSSPVSLASWDHELFSWRTSQVSLLSTEDERFPMSSERWPTSGMTRHGEAFALPMSARPIGASGSSYLPTPKESARNSRKALTQQHFSGLALEQALEVARGITPRELLHTPTTGDTVPNYDHRASPGYVRAKPVPNLHAQIDELLPSPNAWLGRRPENSSPDPERAASRRHAGKRGKRSVELPDVLGSLGEPTNPPSEDGKP